MMDWRKGKSLPEASVEVMDGDKNVQRPRHHLAAASQTNMGRGGTKGVGERANGRLDEQLHAMLDQAFALHRKSSSAIRISSRPEHGPQMRLPCCQLH